MKWIFSILIAFAMLIIIVPFVKIYQLKGYNIKNFFDSIFEIKYSYKGKNKLKWTKRIIRFFTFFVVLEFLIWILILSYICFWWIILLDLVANLIFLPIFLVFLHYLLYPIEKLIKNYYISKTKVILKKFKGIKIAITGSYGKTSTKNILCQLLSREYRVVCSPQNYNTPMGLSLTVLKHLKKDTEVLIVECGARHRGDIKEICEILRPDIGILTSVGEQHLETFGSLENVMKTKFELCESLSPNCLCFFDCYDENAKVLCKKATCKKIGLGVEYKIKQKRFSEEGATFILVNNEVEMKLTTKLLGDFLIRDVCLAVMVALHLGVKKQDVIEQVAMLTSSPHRLEIIKKGNIVIIDDSYNSNFNGFCQALSILKRYKGKRVLITPGMVELGEKQYEFNFKIGKIIAESCDVVIVMNKTNRKALTNGIFSVASEIKVLYAESREEQKQKLAKIVDEKTIVLFENDLPDDYV